jgi:hypothetical protein
MASDEATPEDIARWKEAYVVFDKALLFLSLSLSLSLFFFLLNLILLHWHF